MFLVISLEGNTFHKTIRLQGVSEINSPSATASQSWSLVSPNAGKGMAEGNGSVAEWLACWTQAHEARVQIAVATLSGNSLRQTVHTHRAFVHQAAILVAALLMVAGVTAGLAESNGSLLPSL